VGAGKPEKSAEETTGENLRVRRGEQERVASGSPDFHRRRNQRRHGTSHPKLDRGRDQALGVAIVEQGLKFGDGFVVQPVTPAAGGLVREEHDKDRHAQRYCQPNLETSPHRRIACSGVRPASSYL